MKTNYLDSVYKQFQYYKLLGDQTFEQLEEPDIFWKAHPNSNSIAIIVKHLWGNMRSRWTDFLTADGEKEWRHRDQEFVEDIQTKEELLAKWEEGWQCLFTAVDSVNEDNFETTVYIRNMGHTIVEAINRQLAHYSYHVGQLVFIGTMIKGDNWQSLSIPKGQSVAYNKAKFAQPKRQEHFTEQFLKTKPHMKNLKGVPLETIVDCLVVAFEGYFVQMPSDVAYWRNRFKGARVDWELSFGVFQEKDLVGFIINGVDELNGELTAFNTGTGVIPAYRGQRLVDKMYDYAMPYFKKKGVTKCALEVIQANARAIKVYERIGFDIKRNLKCYKGTLNTVNSGTQIKEINFQEVVNKGLPKHEYYSWDFTNQAMLQSKEVYKTYEVMDTQKQSIGYFIINPLTGFIAQLESASTNMLALLSGVQQVSTSVRINNVDDRRTTLIENLVNCGLENTIDQYEMELLI